VIRIILAENKSSVKTRHFSFCVYLRSRKLRFFPALVVNSVLIDALFFALPPNKVVTSVQSWKYTFRTCKRSLLSVSNTQTPFVDLPFSLFAYIKFHRIFFPLTQLIEFYKGKSNLMNMNYSLLINFFVRCHYIVDTVKLTFTLEVIPQARKHGIKLGILNEIWPHYNVSCSLQLVHDIL